MKIENQKRKQQQQQADEYLQITKNNQDYNSCCKMIDSNVIKTANDIADDFSSFKIMASNNDDNACFQCNCLKSGQLINKQEIDLIEEKQLRKLQVALELERPNCEEIKMMALLNDQSTLLYQNKQVKVKTCADVYDNWRAYKRFYKRKAPKDGIEFNIDYLDTGACMSDLQRSEAPIVLALHGAPGSYRDFAQLIQHLNRQQVRVIAPNFPEYMATVETGILFRHSGDEKAAYLRDFLQAIQVNRIDLLVSHSSAIYPSLLLLLNGELDSTSTTTQNSESESESDSQSDSDCNQNEQLDSEQTNKYKYKQKQRQRKEQKRLERRRAQKRRQSAVEFDAQKPIEIKAIALLNPAGHRMPKSMKPAWFKCGAVHCYQQKLGRYWFRKLGPAFLTVVGVPVKVDNMDNVMLSATVMRNSKCRRVKSQLQLLSEKKIPTLFVFSENDKLIEKEIFYEMTQFLNVNKDSFDTFNDVGQLELSGQKQQEMNDKQENDATSWCKVMVFKAGGHYAYSNYPRIVNQAISELLANSRQQQQTKPFNNSLAIKVTSKHRS